MTTTTRTDLALALALYVALAILELGCTPQQRAKVADVVGDIAAEVCVEGDSVSVCLKKCEKAAADRQE